MPSIPRHLLVAGSTWLSRIVTAGVSFFVVRLLTDLLGEEGYAAYSVLAGLLGWFALGDFGLASTVQNRVAQRRAAGEPHGAVIVYAVRLLGLLWIPLALVLWLASETLGASLLQASGFAVADSRRYFLITAGLLSVTGVSHLAYRVWYGEQRGYLANGVTALAAVGGLLLLSLVSRSSPSDPMASSLVAMLGTPAILGAISLGLVYYRARRDGGEFAAPDRAAARRKSVEFWIFGLMGGLVLHIDIIIISQTLPASDIALYAVLRKFYDIGQVLYAAVLLALWPTWTELTAKGDWTSAQRYLVRYLALGMLGSVALSAAMLFFAPTLLDLLAPTLQLRPSRGLLLVLGGIAAVRVWTTTWAVALQSVDEVRVLWLSAPVQAILNGALQLYMARRWGLEGLLSGLMISYLLTTAWILPVRTVRLARARSGRE